MPPWRSSQISKEGDNLWWTFTITNTSDRVGKRVTLNFKKCNFRSILRTCWKLHGADVCFGSSVVEAVVSWASVVFWKTAVHDGAKPSHRVLQ